MQVINRVVDSKINVIWQWEYIASMVFISFISYCVVPENIHTPPMEGIGNSLGWGFSKAQKFKLMYMKLDWNFQRGGESKERSLPWGRCG